MDWTLSNTKEYSQRCLFVCIVVVLVLLTSCPVKSSIKSLAGIPANTEQGLVKKNDVVGSERCVVGETADTKISPTTSFQTNDWLPIAILVVTFLFLPGYTWRNEQSHPLYGSLKIPGTLPIFLQYQKLII
ncbi:hypothetical protein [Parapedobacter pyrenivorans]|uniref:hypothetical protein n=1 Tax=Parapedobacter pyrenivorans TaxID=1305674 RepID=UPI001663359C|nr:hypothetical protein [Parapedobacter pyrenivorans]